MLTKSLHTVTAATNVARRAVERARAMNRKAARTMKAARLAAGFETVDRVRREFDAWRALAREVQS